MTALPTVLANTHDYFVAVAAKLERLHMQVRGRMARARRRVARLACLFKTHAAC